MHPYLDRLGINPEVQSFFEPYHKDLIFKYGDKAIEQCTENIHRIPVMDSIWLAGEPALATDIFIYGSAMDAICFLHFHYHLFNRPEQLLFISVGSVPTKNQVIRFTAQRYHLVFGKDLLGHICDLKIACWLRNQPILIEHATKNKLKLNFRSKNYVIDQKLFTLNRFERKSGYRFELTTHKPKLQNTFFEQIKYGNPT